MTSWIKKNLSKSLLVLMVLVGSVVVMGVAAVTGTHAQAHAQTVVNARGEDQKLVGVIVSINRTAGTFVLAQDGSKTNVTIAFTANTRFDDGQAIFQAGSHVRVEVIQQNGVLTATEVERAANNGGGNGGGGNGGGGNGGGGNGGGGNGGGPGRG